MPAWNSWDVIFGANSDQIVLGVDFSVTERREAGLAELASKIGAQYKFLQTKMPFCRTSRGACGRSCADSGAGDSRAGRGACGGPCAGSGAGDPLTGHGVSGRSYVDSWVDDIGDRPVMAVLGHRVGSVYAAAIAEGLSRWQRAPRVILFNPQVASSTLLGYELQTEISAISSLLSDDEIERAGQLAAEIVGSGPGDVADTAAAVTGFYWEISSVAYERVGLGGEYCRKSFAPFESYLSLLSAADQIDPSRAWKRSTAIVSSDYANLPKGPSPAGDTRSLIGRSIPFDVSYADLLRSDPVAKTVLDLLELN
jgi:hypothetical protein